ncbi:hypothetical protein [Ramlibacter alkalitolerans]|uniref:Uncharacterized protein n=1 Tax=Ramlibacter alkalitolerans TaxID=2039631 RepID=A0ABS1JU85_9BURK|nr:hypothetical protein [Ramlibacter alkalitolerans]MBL0427855.1 hypothetical protein [Ramlibacter alkalitolerans]
MHASPALRYAPPPEHCYYVLQGRDFVLFSELPPHVFQQALAGAPVEKWVAQLQARLRPLKKK